MCWCMALMAVGVADCLEGIQSLLLVSVLGRRVVGNLLLAFRLTSRDCNLGQLEHQGSTASFRTAALFLLVVVPHSLLLVEERRLLSLLLHTYIALLRAWYTVLSPPPCPLL